MERWVGGTSRGSYALEWRTSAALVRAHESYQPWVAMCSCGYRVAIQQLDAPTICEGHIRWHWLTSLFEWNLA